MAERKNRKKSGFKFTTAKDYRDDRFTMYIMRVETGLLQSGTMMPELTDGDVDKALGDLIYKLKDPEALPQLINREEAGDESEQQEKHLPSMLRLI